MNDVLIQMILSKDGVFVHESATNGEDDVLRAGTVFFWNKVGLCSLFWSVLNSHFMTLTIITLF